MMFHVRLTHSPENCWARDEQEGKADGFRARIENAEESHNVSVRTAVVAPPEHTFYLLAESETYEELTGFLAGAALQDHEADVVPVTTLDEALDTLELN